MWGSEVTFWGARHFAIEVFRTTLVKDYAHSLAGVEQLRNQSYLWELRGLSTLEAIKGCSSWGLIACTVLSLTKNLVALEARGLSMQNLQVMVGDRGRLDDREV